MKSLALSIHSMIKTAVLGLLAVIGVLAGPAADSHALEITLAEVEDALATSSQSDNALARLASEKINEALAAEGFRFADEDLILDGEIPGGDRPCTGVWSPGGSYSLVLDGDSSLSFLVDNLSEPIVFSVTLIGEFDAQLDVQLRIGAKIFGKCIRLARDTVNFAAEADFNVTLSAVLEMNPVLSETNDAILFSPVVEVMADVNRLDFDLDISGIGGTINFWSYIPVVGPFINDQVANVAIDFVLALVDVEGVAQDALDDVASDLTNELQWDLTAWSNANSLSLPPFDSLDQEQIGDLLLRPGLLAIPVSAEYYNANRNRLLFAFLVGDDREVSNILTGAAACAAASAVASPDVVTVPVYQLSGGVCSQVNALDESLTGSFFTNATCTAALDMAPLSFASYCSEVVAATPNDRLGNAAGLTAEQQKWRPAVATSIDVSVDPVDDNRMPFFKRTLYKVIPNVNEGYERPFDEISELCDNVDNLEDICGCSLNSCGPPNDQGCIQCQACQTTYQYQCNRRFLDPPLGEGMLDRLILRGNGTCELEMRVYKKDPNATGLTPLLALHGGSWKYRGFGFFGMESLISHYTERDFAVFVPFYRLTGDDDGNIECNGANSTQINSDVATALNWARDNASAFGAADVPVRLVGQSAGAGLAAWLAINYEQDVYGGWLAYPPTDAAHFIATQIQVEDPDPLVVSGQAARALRDYLDADLDTIDLTSNIVVQNSYPALVAANPSAAANVFITHGVADTLVPASQSQRLCNGYESMVDDGPVPLFGGDPQALTYQAVYPCGSNDSQLRLYAQADHALEFCLPGIVCASGDAPSQALIRSGMHDALSFLAGDAVDSDGDLVYDSEDNCINVANANQLDVDGDGFGNACDTDLNGDCGVSYADLALFRLWFDDPTPSAADFNGDGAINTVDLGALRATFFGEPGPSAQASCD